MRLAKDSYARMLFGLHETATTNAVFRYIQFEHMTEGYCLKRWQIMAQFDLPECVANSILGNLQNHGEIIWDERGIRPTPIVQRRAAK